VVWNVGERIFLDFVTGVVTDLGRRMGPQIRCLLSISCGRYRLLSGAEVRARSLLQPLEPRTGTSRFSLQKPFRACHREGPGAHCDFEWIAGYSETGRVGGLAGPIRNFCLAINPLRPQNDKTPPRG